VQGYWIPDSGEKIAVAIKVLSEGTTACQNKELLEEARIMASVIHPCCVQIRAICMTARIMLVSELMPMGCLLDYVRNNGDKLSSYTLLLWSKQIAQVCKFVAFCWFLRVFNFGTVGLLRNNYVLVLKINLTLRNFTEL